VQASSHRRVRSIVCLAFAASVLPSLVSRSEGKTTIVDDCSQGPVSVSGNVKLGNDLVGATNENCLVIAADKTTIRLNGKTMTGGAGIGIFNPGFEKVKILGPGTITNFSDGVQFLAGSHKAKIMKIEAAGNFLAGISVIGPSDNVQVKGNSVHDNGEQGILVESAKGLVHGNTVTSNGTADGIAVGGDKIRVSNNEVSLSGQVGILIGPSGTNFTVIANTAHSNGTNTNAPFETRVGIATHPSAGSVGKILRNKANNNPSLGIKSADGVKGKNNHAEGNNAGGQQCDPSYLCR
jgi:parallel beta-helix repeat protein